MGESMLPLFGCVFNTISQRCDSKANMSPLTGRYHYQVLVTNLHIQPLNLWRFYNNRAAVELIIKQLKGDYRLGNIPTRLFHANETYFHLLLSDRKNFVFHAGFRISENGQAVILWTLMRCELFSAWARSYCI